MNWTGLQPYFVQREARQMIDGLKFLTWYVGSGRKDCALVAD